MNDDKSKTVKCCSNCFWWEPRSGFCRCNPPFPVAINDKLNTQIIAMWPKIPCPQLDYCGKFKHINSTLI